MEFICDTQQCTGCMACLNICPTSAIEMKENEIGFLHPSINQNTCIDCGRCEKVCPVNHPLKQKYPLKGYATMQLDEDDLKKSSSGGVATELIRKAIQEGGVAYGASSKDVYRVQHLRINQLEDVDLLRGSKYVQSRIDETFKSVKADLSARVPVIFTGTPCQIAGLKSFLRKDYDYLLTVDLVCHGVPSQKLLTESIRSYTTEADGTKLKLAFREKRRRKKDNKSYIQFGFFLHLGKKRLCNKQIVDNPYIYGFLRSLFFRDCCYTCPYAKSERVSDITIADFWGLGKDSGLEHGKGVSLCLVNTEKGQEWFEKISTKMLVTERSIEEGIRGNNQLQHPSYPPAQYEVFKQLYPKVGLKKATYRSLRKLWIKEKSVRIAKDIIKTILGYH